jgi:NAD(P)H-dependent flavin oxidoreductase YrpB (nitropropane dioxygenase family)
MEGGGHTGYVASTVLIPEVVDAVKIPVVAAGGFSDGRGLIAALAFGAVGIAMGTRFLLTKESPIPDHIKQIYMEAPSNGTIVSDRIDGLPQRVLKSRVVDILESQGRGFPLVRGVRGFFQMREIFQEVSSWRLLQSAWGRKKTYEVSLSQLALAGTFPRMLTRATVEGNADEGVMPSGQVAGVIKDIPTCQELIERIVSQAAEILDEFQQ